MSDEISGPDDNAKYEGEIAKIDSKIAALAELKQQYLKQLSAAKGTKSMPARSPILSVDEKLSLFQVLTRKENSLKVIPTAIQCF